MKNTIVDLNVHLAQKQQLPVAALIEKNPIIASIPMKPASHGIYNVYSKTLDIQTAQEVDYDAELPTVGISFDLGQTRLGKIGGKLPIPMDAAMNMGGWQKYVDDRMPSIIGKSGNENEAKIYYSGFLKYALANKRVISAGGKTSDKQFSMVAVHYDRASTVGLYNPNTYQNGSGKLFTQLMLNGGNVHELEVEGKKCLGKMLAVFMEFGLQLADPDAVNAIVNIEPAPDTNNADKIAGLPTAMQINDMLAAVRADTAATVIYAHPVLVNYLAIKYNLDKRSVTDATTGVSYNLTEWNGVPLIGSYNISWGKESVIDLA